MSPGVAEFGGDVSWDANATHVAQIAGSNENEYDQVVAAGGASLDGVLRVELSGAPEFSPTAGDRFTLIESASLTGAFATLDAPTLPSGLDWRLMQTASSLELWAIAPTGLTGDFNHDGRVDAADYTVWRDSAGSAGPHQLADANGDQAVDGVDLELWRNAFGDSVPPALVVPEPAAWLLLAGFIAAKLVRGDRLP